MPNLSEVNVLDGKLALEGNIEFVILYYKNDKMILETKKMELPFQQVIKIPEIQSNMNAQINTEIENLEHKSIGSNQLQIKLDMNVSVLSNEEVNINSIKNVEESEEKLPRIPSIIVYYVKPGDSLWSIAKRFQTTVEDLKSINELTENIIYPNQQLIIQKKTVIDEVESLL